MARPLGTERLDVPSLFGGALVEVIAVPLLLIPGALLCFTGIGAVLGIPMIVGAIAAPLLGLSVGATKFKGSTLQPGAESPSPDFEPCHEGSACCWNHSA